MHSLQKECILFGVLFERETWKKNAPMMTTSIVLVNTRSIVIVTNQAFTAHTSPLRRVKTTPEVLSAFSFECIHFYLWEVVGSSRKSVDCFRQIYAIEACSKRARVDLISQVLSPQ